MKKKFAVEGALREKIEQLFEYRKLNELIRLGQLDKNPSFLNHLIDIQTQIYMLDAYLESHWDLDKQELNNYWEAISNSLSELGYETIQHEKLLASIHEYERIERRCRKDKWPTEVSFTKFYTTKSCDVQLIRHLIYSAAPLLRTTWKESVWTYYDLITEINDDITDLEEDVLTYNGNRFLISILRIGSKKTETAYKKFICKVKKRADAYFTKHPKQQQHHELHDWITSRSAESLELLEKTIQEADVEHLSAALVLQHMK